MMDLAAYRPTLPSLQDVRAARLPISTPIAVAGVVAGLGVAFLAVALGSVLMQRRRRRLVALAMVTHPPRSRRVRPVRIKDNDAPPTAPAGVHRMPAAREKVSPTRDT